MRHRQQELGPGYSSEFDAVSETEWTQLLQQFDDANIYQTWAYGEVLSGRRNLSHFVLRKDGQAVAIAQVRIARIPVLKVGIAYVFWGPLWRRGESQHPGDAFRQSIRALRNEFVCKRGLTLRVFPQVFSDDPPCFSSALEQEGFSPVGAEFGGRTILMDVKPPLKKLLAGVDAHWRRNLRLAERSGMEVVSGKGDELFESFIQIYREMVARKRFVEPNDINQFRRIQARLPERLKMHRHLSVRRD
jgi:lipid II:glycine glycyltransferase (peptidoglycan interpeptide bridge formation enzyme)